MLNLLSLHPFNEQDRAKLINGLGDLYHFIFPEKCTEEDLAVLADSADVMVGLKISKPVLTRCSKLKLLQTPSAGVDTLPLSALKDKGVMVCNSHSNSYYVAEYAVSLLQDLIKKMTLSEEEPATETLKGKVVGILGYGKIGKQVSEFLHPFGCMQLIFNRCQAPEMEKNSARSFTQDLKEVLSQADYIIITLPLTPTTRDLIGEKEITLMKKSAGLINVGRGPVINQEALYLALKNKKIRAAAIDVWYDDFQKTADSVLFSTRYPFEELDNIILSPYRAAIVSGAPHLDDVITNLRLFATSGKVINRVDLEQGY